MAEHKVLRESVGSIGKWNMISVTLYCTGCKQAFGGKAQRQMGRETREQTIARARKNAETAFREHLPIR